MKAAACFITVSKNIMPTRFDPKIHHRKSIRLKGYDYSQAGAYFVTIVSQGGESFFGEIRDGEMIFNDAGRMVNAVWESMPERFPQIELGSFVVMPNHFHAIVIIQGGVGLVPGPGTTTTGGAGLVPGPEATTNGGAGLVLGPEATTTGGAGLVPALRATTRVAPTSSATPTDRVAPTLGQIIGAFKSITTHEYIAGVDNHGWTQFYKRLWQRNYYERIIRNEKAMDAIWRYIEANPASWGEDEENSPNPKSHGMKGKSRR